MSPAADKQSLEAVERDIVGRVEIGEQVDLSEIASRMGPSISVTLVRRAIWDLLDRGMFKLTSDFRLTRQS